MPNKSVTKEKVKLDWKIVLAVSSAIIILLVIFFIVQTAVRNPLEGEWYSKERGYSFDIDDDGEVTVEFEIKEIYVEVELPYVLDKDSKIFTIKPKASAYEEASKETDTMVSAQQIDEHLTEILTSFEYSIEKDTLTLTEREYAEQFIFTRVE